MDKKTIWKVFGEAFLRSMVVLMAILILGFTVFFVVKVISDKNQKSGTSSETGSTYSDDELEEMLNKENAKDGEDEGATSEEATTEEVTTEQVVDISSKDQSILVLNSTGVAGLAKKWMDKLKAEGFSNVKTGNYSESASAQTKIYVPEDGMGKDLAEYYTDAVIEVGSLSSGIDVSTDGVQIFIVLGTNDTSVQ